MPDRIECPLAAFCLDPRPVYKEGGVEVFCAVASLSIMHGHALNFPILEGLDVKELADLVEHNQIVCPKSGEII